MMEVRCPSFEELEKVVANAATVEFRYGSSRRACLVTPATAEKVVKAYRKADGVGRARISRMVRTSLFEFQRLLAYIARN